MLDRVPYATAESSRAKRQVLFQKANGLRRGFWIQKYNCKLSSSLKECPDCFIDSGLIGCYGKVNADIDELSSGGVDVLANRDGAARDILRPIQKNIRYAVALEA